MKFLDFFKHRSLVFYLGLAAGIVGLAVTIFYAAYSGSAYGKINGGSETGSHFNTLIFVLLLFGTLSTALPIIKPEWKFTPAVPAAFFSAAFGYYINDRLIMIEEHVNHIYGMMESGGNLQAVIAIFALMLIPILTLIVASFFDGEKKIGERV